VNIGITKAGAVFPRWISYPVTRWAELWVEQMGAILLLTAVNLVLTTVTELVFRQFLVSNLFSWSGSHEFGFFVQTPHGFSIHRQSLVNIFMTGFASLFAGPVYFFSRRKFRFLFFLGFGLVSSLLAQNLAELVRAGTLGFLASRLMFDLAYTSLIRFPMFEIFRGRVASACLSTRRVLVRVTSWRTLQDASTSFVRILVLNLIGLRG
jgi:hypothetical protein